MKGAKGGAQSQRKVQGQSLVAETKPSLHDRGAGSERTWRLARMLRGTDVGGCVTGGKNSQKEARRQRHSNYHVFGSQTFCPNSMLHPHLHGYSLIVSVLFFSGWQGRRKLSG